MKDQSTKFDAEALRDELLSEYERLAARVGDLERTVSELRSERSKDLPAGTREKLDRIAEQDNLEQLKVEASSASAALPPASKGSI